MKIAFVYDWVNKVGGAERVLTTLHEIWPEAPLYTAVYDSNTSPWAKTFAVTPSFINKVPFARNHHELYPWLTSICFESFDFLDYDVVVSITSADAKAIITSPRTLHLCYCLTPTRYLWSGYDIYFRNKYLRFITIPLVRHLRKFDLIAAQRPDQYIAISNTIKKRIRDTYQRNSIVIYPPIDLNRWRLSRAKTQDYFLVVSRLVPYKKIDLVVKAFNVLKLPLKIIGAGSEVSRLKGMAANNIEFLGQLTDSQLLNYYEHCRAVIFPQEEDFGIVPLEAQACGKPVIAYRQGGALETVIEGKTGIFFDGQSEKAIIEAVNHFCTLQFDPKACYNNAKMFNKDRFKKEFKKFVEDTWKKTK